MSCTQDKRKWEDGEWERREGTSIPFPGGDFFFELTLLRRFRKLHPPSKYAGKHPRPKRCTFANEWGWSVPLKEGYKCLFVYPKMSGKLAVFPPCPSCLPPLPEVHFVKKEDIFETNFSTITLPLDHTQLRCEKKFSKTPSSQNVLPRLAIIDFFCEFFSRPTVFPLPCDDSMFPLNNLAGQITIMI
jgi:hypothetical protein